MTDPVRVIRPEERERFVPPNSHGIAVEQAQTTETSWAGIVRFEPGAEIGWHHHGDFDTHVHVLAGDFHVDFGPAGRDSIDAAAEDFVVIPKGAVHRETNPGERTSVLAFVRIGSGQVMFPAEGPEPA